MKITEVNRSAAVAWNPVKANANLIATATVDGTIDTNFDTSAHLELFSLDVGSKNEALRSFSRAPISERVTSLAWGCTGVDPSLPLGVLAAGSANGTITFWDPSKLTE
jgi:protein transport protein SEC31